MKTKAELEAEINDLKVQVAGLKAAVEAYQFAFEHMNKPQEHVWADYKWTNPFAPKIDPNVYPYQVYTTTASNNLI